jgi:late embryogenesis abundant protein
MRDALVPFRTHPPSRISHLAYAVVWVAVGACATLGRLSFQEPVVSLQEIDLIGIGLTGGTFDLVFDVWNPNDYRIRSTRLEVGIDLEGTHFGDALLDRPLDLSPTNHSRVVMPVRFEWAGLGAGAKALVTKRAVGYAITGTVLLDTPLGEQRVAVKGQGNAPLRKLIH